MIEFSLENLNRILHGSTDLCMSDSSPDGPTTTHVEDGLCRKAVQSRAGQKQKVQPSRLSPVQRALPAVDSNARAQTEGRVARGD